MSTFGMDEWLADGRTPLNAPILAADYMDLILERQRVYEAVNPPVKWARTLPEWFVWPGDDDFVILPDRVTAEPKPKRTPPTREALIAKRDALQSQLGRLHPHDSPPERQESRCHGQIHRRDCTADEPHQPGHRITRTRRAPDREG